MLVPFDILKSKALKHYLWFNLIIVFISGILLSIIAFFHFLLGHELSVIENWANMHYWEFLIIIKFSLLFGYKKWFELNYFKKFSLREFFKTWHWQWNQRMIIFIFFMNIMLHFLLKENLTYVATSIGAYNIFITVLGISSLFFVDYFFIQWISYIFSEETKWNKVHFTIILTCIFCLGTYLYLPHMQEKVFLFGFIFAGLWLHSFLWMKSSLDIILYILGICVPLSVLWGFDPVWGDEFSFFKLAKMPNFLILIGWWMIGISYSSGKFNKYIHRFID
jgi:hypothetical protein